jgi:hypothetical protein
LQSEGTTLQIPVEWTECTVVFKTTDRANPGRLNEKWQKYPGLSPGRAIEMALRIHENAIRGLWKF